MEVLLAHGCVAVGKSKKRACDLSLVTMGCRLRSVDWSVDMADEFERQIASLRATGTEVHHHGILVLVVSSASSRPRRSHSRPPGERSGAPCLYDRGRGEAFPKQHGREASALP